MIEKIAGHLDDSSMASLSLASKAMHVGVEHPLQLRTALHAAESANSQDDFSACCKTIDGLAPDRGGLVLEVLTKRLLTIQQTMSVETVLPICSVLIDSLNEVPVGEGSAKLVGSPLTSVYDSIQRLLARSGPMSLAGELNGAAAQAMVRTGSSEMVRLNELIGKHLVRNVPAQMDHLLETLFSANNGPLSVMMAAASFPKHMASLEAGKASDRQVIATLTKLATLANGDRGLTLLDAPEIPEWRSWLLERIDGALNKHGIDASSDPGLKTALKDLREPPEHAPGPVEAA